MTLKINVASTALKYFVSFLSFPKLNSFSFICTNFGTRARFLHLVGKLFRFHHQNVLKTCYCDESETFRWFKLIEIIFDWYKWSLKSEMCCCVFFQKKKICGLATIFRGLLNHPEFNLVSQVYLPQTVRKRSLLCQLEGFQETHQLCEIDRVGYRTLTQIYPKGSLSATRLLLFLGTLGAFRRSLFPMIIGRAGHAPPRIYGPNLAKRPCRPCPVSSAPIRLVLRISRPIYRPQYEEIHLGLNWLH